MPAFAACTKARVVALVSGDGTKAQTVAAQYGISPDAVHDYAALDRLGPEVQAVYIVTPNGLHLEHVRAAAHGKKHVLCEKPMART